ncbi:uncharacterized protein METZ01_LOCUS447215, partial [marine metagenome]
RLGDMPSRVGHRPPLHTPFIRRSNITIN